MERYKVAVNRETQYPHTSPALKPAWRQVITSRPNMAEVVIVWPPKTGKEPAMAAGDDQVSESIFGHGSAN